MTVMNTWWDGGKLSPPDFASAINSKTELWLHGHVMAVSKDRIMRVALESLGPAQRNSIIIASSFGAISHSHRVFADFSLSRLSRPGEILQSPSPTSTYPEIREYCVLLPSIPSVRKLRFYGTVDTYTREETDRGKFRAATRDLQGTLPSRIVSPCAVNSRHLRVDRARFLQRGCTLLGVC